MYNNIMGLTGILDSDWSTAVSSELTGIFAIFAPQLNAYLCLQNSEITGENTSGWDPPHFGSYP